MDVVLEVYMCYSIPQLIVVPGFAMHVFGWFFMYFCADLSLSVNSKVIFGMTDKRNLKLDLWIMTQNTFGQTDNIRQKSDKEKIWFH